MSRFEADTTEVRAALRRAGPVVLDLADRALGAGAQLVRREAVRLSPKAEGTLHRNIQTRRLELLVHEVSSGSAHGGFVEDGTGRLGKLARASNAKMLPDDGIARIALWIKRRGITPRNADVSAEQLPWLIAAKIARQGTPAQPYMEPALKASEPRIQQLVRAAAERGLRDAGFVVT